MNNVYQFTADQSLNENTQAQTMNQVQGLYSQQIGGVGSSAQGINGNPTTGYYNYYSYQWPYYNYPTTHLTYIQSEPVYEIKVEKVANGFIVHKNGEKFVVSKPEEIVKYLKNDDRSK